LTDHALSAEQAGVSATTVWTPASDQGVIAYHSIAPTVLRRDELPSPSMAGGYTTVPGYLLGRLAVDRELHGQGLGSQLLIDALERIVSASGQGGGRVIVVDAIDDAAAAFYENHHFKPVAGTNRLVMKVATARAALSR
jgi:GNAT superfamily N-acetyltransferase